MAYSPSTPRKTPQANPTDETHIYNKIKRTTIWFCGGGWGVAVYVESEYLFPIFCGRQYLFSSNFSKDHLFYVIAYLNLMDAGLFIYFLRDPGRPPPPINFTSPNKKGTSFNHSPIVTTAILNTLPCSTGFGLVDTIWCVCDCCCPICPLCDNIF